MPRAKTTTAIPKDIILEFLDKQNSNQPKYTSFVSRNAAIIESRTTNSMLSTEGEGTSKDLKKGENEKLRAILGPDYSDQFKSPYDTVDLIRFHEVWRDDGIAAAAIDFLIQFMLGDHFKTIIDVNTEFDSEEEQNAALEAYNNNPTIRGYKKKIDQINREIRFQTYMFSLLIQAFVFGRACGLVERSDIDGLPIAIKIMPSMHLGQVYVHRKTWHVLGVEHKDFKFPASILKSEDIIYFPVRNHNMSPGTFHYGYSLVERIVDLSELNRITNQRNLKEINYRLWAAFLLIRLVGSYNKETMKKLKDQLAKGAGNSIITNQQAQIEIHQITHDMEKLLDEREKNYREEIRQLQIPVILFDPDILNRATSQELMEAWTVSVLKAYRSWLKDIIQDQWINPMLKTMIENDLNSASEAAAQRGGLPIGEIDETREEKTVLSKDILPLEARDPATNEVLVYRLPWKIKLEFEPHNYDTFRERAETAILLKNNGLATTEKALRMMGFDDEIEKQKLIELEAKRQAQRFGNPEAAAAGEPNRQRSIDRQREGLKESLRKTIQQGEKTEKPKRPSRTGD